MVAAWRLTIHAKLIDRHSAALRQSATEHFFEYVLGTLMRLTLLATAVLATFSAGSLLAAPPKVGDKVADFELKSLGGETVTLKSITSDGPALVIVLRGFPGYQCPLCSRQVGDFVGRAAEFAKAKTSLVFVYPGDVDDLGVKATEFLDGKELPSSVTFLLDPGYTFTNAWDLRWNARNETAYPSTFLVSQEGVVLGAKVSKSHGGRTSAADILGAMGGGSSTRSGAPSGKKAGSKSRN